MRPASLLAVVLGFSDGILTALTLAAGRLTTGPHVMTFGLSFRIATGALVSGAFVFFVARYAQLRHELIRAEHQLNLSAHGQLAASHLGAHVLRDALGWALISSVASFAGALVPLVSAAALPQYRWISIAAALVALGLLGGSLAHAVNGRTLRWSVGLVAGGGALSIVGAYLRIVG